MIQIGRINSEARRIMNDRGVASSHTYSDEDVLGALELSLNDARRLRPDYFTNYFVGFPELRMDGSLNLDGFLITPLALMTAAYCMMESNEYLQEGASANLMALSRSQLGGA